MKLIGTCSDESTPVANASAETVATFIESAHVRDLADWLGAQRDSSLLHHLAALPLPRRADVFGYLPLDVQAHLARAIDLGELIGIFVEMDADDRADLFKILTDGKRQQVLLALPVVERGDIERLAAHKEETAGAIMTSDFVTLEPTMKINEAIAALRCAAPKAETIYRSYVLDEDGCLIGSVRLHDLILSADEALISDIMEPAPVAVELDTDQEDVAKAIARYDILAIAVVDIDGRLVGIVTHDDAADALQAESTEDFQKMSTVLPFSQSLLKAGIGMLYRKRIVWLALLVFGNLFSGAGHRRRSAERLARSDFARTADCDGARGNDGAGGRANRCVSGWA